MKKIKLLLGIFLCLIILPTGVSAASGKISVSSTSQVVVGNSVTVTVTLSSGTSIGSWQLQLNYDKNYLQLTSTDSEGGGVRMAASSSTGVKSKKYTFKFKALKTGSTSVSVGSYLAYAFDDMSEISLTSDKKTIKIITQKELEASYSKDNNLKSLTVEGYTISPEFNKDTLNYTVEVPEGTTSIKVNATPSDSKSSVSGDGDVTVTEGVNNISIVVRAENGSEKTYNLVVNVVDQNPINVTVDNENYTVIKLRNNYECPTAFEDSEISISGINVPACYNSAIKYTLVGLKKSDGTVENFIYDNGKYTKYLEVTGTSLKIVIENYNGNIDGYIKTKANINGTNYDVFKISDNSKTYIVYGINVETGKKDFYVYDTVNKTFGLYDNEQVNNLKKLNDTYLYVIIAFGVALLLSLMCIISLSKSKKKIINNLTGKNTEEKDKKIPKKEISTEEVEQITEEKEEEEEEYNILEEDKKHKRKKKKEGS